MDNVFCRGTESALFECSHNGFDNHNCIHGEDAGVVCSSESILELWFKLGCCSQKLVPYHTLYSRNFCRTKNLPTQLSLQHRNRFCMYVIINPQDKKVCGIKFSLMKVGDEKGQFFFSRQKFLAIPYTLLGSHCTCIYIFVSLTCRFIS